MNAIKWGVIGSATIATTQVIPAIQRSENSELYAVASRDINKIQCYRDVCAKLYGSYDELLNDPCVQAVYIPLPNTLHKEWTVKALNAGKHVLCEKPLAMNYAECVEMAEAAERNGRYLMEAFMYRFTAKSKMIEDIVTGGKLGSIQYVHTGFGFEINDPQNVRLRKKSGGGALFDLGCYTVNFLNFIGKITHTHLLDARASFVTRKDVDGEYVDVRCNAALNFENGMAASAVSWFDALPYHQATIVGRSGALHIPYVYAEENLPMTLMRYDYANDPNCRGKEIMFIDDAYFVKERIFAPRSDRYCLEVSEFSDAIIQKREPSFTVEESLRNMKTLGDLYAQMKPNEKSPAKPRF